jgi:hypothetical protein
MIRLTDRQLEILRELATPLSPFQRGRFLQLVAERLTNITIGDGAVHQAGIAAQHEVLNRAHRFPASSFAALLLTFSLSSLY